MPGRISRATIATPKARTQRKKSQKRALDAFSIAAHSQKKATYGVPRHRLGDLEPDGSKSKRRRTSDAHEDELEDGQASKRARPADNDEEHYSDDEGNTWTMGAHIADEDDSEIDSDEAFGESDEERFEGFTFRGSSSNVNTLSTKRRQVNQKNHLNEDQSSIDSDDNDGLGPDAVDLATMLDDDHASDLSESDGTDQDDSSHDDSDDASQSDTEPSDADADADADDADPEKLAKLQDLVASLETGLGEKSKPASTIDAHEAQPPSAFGLTSSQKLRVADLLPTVKDPALRKSLKVLATDKPSKRASIPGKLNAPLPKIQQDRLDRKAANQKAKETLERWRDTVIQNRRAEHLQFPLQDPNYHEPQGTNKLVAVQQDKPQTDLENAIQDILEASGLSSAKRDQDEKLLQEAETLQMNKMPIDEVMARRAELRKTRELLFREEARAKRVKKIKSKSYRRVHRKERERQREIDQSFMDPDGEGLDEDGKEQQDRRRAEERMGAKHRESKWAKSMKQSGRTVWDDDARDGMVEMARRNEELRKRIEGKDLAEDGTSSVESFHTSDESDGHDDTEGHGMDENERLGKQLDRLGSNNDPSTSKLGKLGFMQRAEAAKRQMNNDAIEDIRRELAGDEAEPQDTPDTQLGRRIFGPKADFGRLALKPAVKRAELEELPGSDDEDVEIIVEKPESTRESARSQAPSKLQPTRNKTSRLQQSNFVNDDDSNDDDPWLTASTGNKKKKSSSKSQIVKEFIPTFDAAPAHAQPKAAMKTVHQKKSTQVPDTTADDSDNEAANQNAMITEKDKQAMYHARAFAGDEAQVAFEAEKTTQTKDEDEREVSTHVPGWGSWTGDGLSKSIRKTNARTAHNPLFKSKFDGVRPADRKDGKLKDVIISESSQRKSKKYLASQLPHEFEKAAQYERSLRIPLGPEWTTKDTFQRNTKPRVIVKQGVIEPMSKPMV